MADSAAMECHFGPVKLAFHGTHAGVQNDPGQQRGMTNPIGEGLSAPRFRVPQESE